MTLLLAAGLLALVPVLTACQTGPATDTASGGCDVYQLDDGSTSDTTYPLLLVLLDVNDNSAASAGQVAAALRPYLDVAVRDGEYVRLVASGGENSGLTYSPCFTGQNVFKVDRANKTRERKDRVHAGDALATQIEHTVQSVHVNPTGSVTDVLAGVDHEIEAVRTTPGLHLGRVTILVWSDLLGKTNGPDCLNVDGQQASPALAEGLVRRCFATAQLSSLGSDTVRFLGVDATTGTRPQQDMARYLEGELCRRLSTDCV
ncbi:MAG: hypothetical protein ACQSGP_23325 [Frankia sp.]